MSDPLRDDRPTDDTDRPGRIGPMGPERLVGFSDGVIAVIITIMVLEIVAPAGHEFKDLGPVVPKLLVYLLSFIFVGIYWNNHHHMIRATARISPVVMWANLHLLFWLSLIPFATAWMGEGPNQTAPVAVYGILCFCCGAAYSVLQFSVIRANPDDEIGRRIGNDYKGYASVIVYAVGVLISFFLPLLSLALYATVALIWFIPDRRLAS